MALSKPTFLTHLKNLSKHHQRHLPSPSSYLSLRFLSFATPEEAAAERRRRKRRLRIEPPLSSSSAISPKPQTPRPQIPQNPNSPKLPEPVSAVSGNRLNLHNRILTLIRQNELDEATLFTRHSIYSNCRPTIFTVNSVLAAQLRQSKYADLLSLHRFITQAGVAPNVITYNLIFQTYLDCRKPDTAMEHYKQMINNAPFNPSPTTYRILVKGLVDNDRLERAMELKDDMVVKGFKPDPLIYHYLMAGCVKNSDFDGVFKLFDELKEKLGGSEEDGIVYGFVEDGVVYGNLMYGYFMKGKEEEAMRIYDEVLRENSKVKMSAVAYNSVLNALSKNGKFDEALKFFDRILKEHNPPNRLAVNLGSFNVMVNGYCAQGKFKDAIEVFRMIGDYRCSPDTLSFNNLIEQLSNNDMLIEAEEIYREMGDKAVNPDEFTYVLLMDACFKENRPADAAVYFRKMVESGLRPNLAVYDRLVDGLVKVGKINEAKSFFDLMVKKLKMNAPSYKFIIKVLSDAGKLDDVINVANTLLDDDGIEFTVELQEYVKEELRKEGRQEELVKLMEGKERQKAEAKAKEAEAAEAAKRSARAAVSSLLPSKLFGNKENEESAEAVNEKAEAGQEESSGESKPAGSALADVNLAGEVIKGENSTDVESRSDEVIDQVKA